MILSLADWRFRVDLRETAEHTTRNAADHCLCGYCKNYYDTVSLCYPGLEVFLQTFGVNINGPSELMPFEPTFLIACYRVQGEILRWGSGPLWADGIAVLPEPAGEGSFFLWVGEMTVPWVQEEDMEEVVSPANLPEFLDRMEQMWLLRHGKESVLS